jgi:hypothetical protein
MVSLEDAPFVVYRRRILLHGCPACLQMAVEEKWVELACGYSLLRNIYQGLGAAVLGLERNGSG